MAHLPVGPRPLLRATGIGNSPDGVANVIGDQQSTRSVQRYADRASASLSVPEEASDEILWHPGGTPIAKANEHHLVAVRLRPVPAAMLADERSPSKAGGKARAGIECEPKRRHMRAQCIVWRYRLCDQIRTLRPYT